MISEELFSEVIGEYPLSINTDDNEIRYEKDIGWTRAINIYELAHKCKEWADNEFGYIMQSWTLGKEGKCKLSNITNGVPIVVELCLMNADTETEAIFKTCEWILNDRR